MNVLLTGNNGYVGSVLSEILNQKSYSLTGLDVDFFESCTLEESTLKIPHRKKDIRDIEHMDLKGFDAIIHLAALSNDPLGELDLNLTKEINYHATIRLAQMAKEVGIKRFVYASSQSMYGISTESEELDEDNSPKRPVTAYAKTKWEAELELRKMSSSEFVVVCFRPATIFGASPRLRCDVVFNNLVACAYTTGKIEILSDGSPWRPVVHVRDVCQAFLAGLEAPQELINGLAFNVGIPDGNFSVRELAESAQRIVPGSELIFMNQHTDPRTYRVSFERILSVLGEYYQPEWDLDKGGLELVEQFERSNFSEKDFRGPKCNRYAQLHELMTKNIIDQGLRFL